MIKKTLLYAAGITMFAASCQKSKDVTGTEISMSTVSLINANASAKSVDFIVDGNKKSVNAPVPANGIILGTYIGISRGAPHSLVVKDATNGSDYYSGTLEGLPNKAYSLYVYDTLTAGKFKTLYLTTNRALSSGNLSTSNIRFLNLSPKSPVLDCWFVRIVGTVRTDSVKAVALASYVGSTSTPDVNALSAYTTINANQAAGANGTGSAITSYVVKLTVANTNTIVASLATTIVPGRNYTIFARGLYPSTSIGIVADN